MKVFRLMIPIELLIVFCALFSKQSTASATDCIKINAVAEEIYIETYHFRFNKVDSLISVYDSKYKDDLSYNLSVINFYWWKLLSSKQNNKYAELISERIETIEAKYIKRIEKPENDQLFLLISIFTFNARVNLINNSYFGAISNLSKYYSFLEISFGREPEYNPLYLTSGLYYFFAGLAKKRTPFLSPLLYFYTPGNMDLGLKFIRKAATSDRREIREEAEYFLMKINFEVFKNNSESAFYCNKLTEKYPENILFQLYKVKIELALGNQKEAKGIIGRIETNMKSSNQLTFDEKEYYLKLVKSEYDYIKK